jgi:hypothetical protein
MPIEQPPKSILCGAISEADVGQLPCNIEYSQSSYSISFQPPMQGRYQLSVQISGRHVRGSPFAVVVKKKKTRANHLSKSRIKHLFELRTKNLSESINHLSQSRSKNLSESPTKHLSQSHSKNLSESRLSESRSKNPSESRSKNPSESPFKQSL